MTVRKFRIIIYKLPADWTLLVGTSDVVNDYLSTNLAAQEDWWFHAESVPGSHVILKAKPNEEPSRDTLLQAAAVAAYHSKARKARNARIYQTRARNVKKKRGSEVGTVEVSLGKILKVRPDISFATRLHGDSQITSPSHTRK